MQTLTPVDVRVEKDCWHENRTHGNVCVRKTASANNRTGKTTKQVPPTRMRTCVTNKIKTNRSKSCQGTAQQFVPTKQVQPVRSRSPSPTSREPWVPPPGRSTKGQKFAWQGSKARLEINPVLEALVHDDVDDEESLNTDRQKTDLIKQISCEQDEKLNEEIQTYEKRIQGLIEGVGMLKERARHRVNQDETNQLRADINSTLINLEQAQQTIRNSRSSSVDESRLHRSTKVSFNESPTIEKRRARSTTPVRGPLHLNPDREQLLISLSESEADIAQITKQLSAVKDILTKLKFDDQPVSFEVEQLYQQRNHLLYLIEQFERSNHKLKEFLRHQYHLEAEHGLLNENTDSLLTRTHELQNENQQIRRLLLERENDNIALQTELERVRTHAIGFDTMKTSLEHNRAHLQRELYAKEGEINRLQCVLRSLERDLQRSRYQCDTIQRSIKRTPMYPHSSPNAVGKTKGLTVEKLQAQLTARDRQIDELERKLYGEKTEQLIDADSEITRLRKKLEHAERLVTEYKEQLQTQTLKSSINNSKTHLSEIELDKMRIRLQKRIEELEPLPELLRQAEMKNQELQTCLIEQDKRLAEQATIISELTTKASTQNHIIERIKDNHYTFDDDYRVLQQKIEAFQRQIFTLEEDNANLLRNLNNKEEALRNAQTRLNAKSHELATLTKQVDLTQTDLKTREDSFGSKERSFQQRVNDYEQQISRLRQELAQLKREKEECERRYTSQLGELRDKLEQSNNNNRSMQNYVNSLKTTYASVFNDSVTPPFPSTTSYSRFSTATIPSVYP